jgi:hypothetical protein
MSPIQQMLLGVGAVATKTYVDDVFSTYVYKGTGSALTINNGINMSGEGGMTWLKERDGSYSHRINDTERGANKQLYTNLTNAEATETTELTSFNNNGFSLGTSTSTNDSNNTYASWTFRKAKGFFDVVTWTGNGTARTIAHSLGSVPGCILIKCTSAGFNWMVYHRGANGGVNPAEYGLRLNATDAQSDNTTYFNDTLPTSTHFTIGTNAQVNSNGSTYVAYVFAGGSANSQALARSVSFDGSDDELYFGSTTDFEFGTGDFTWEAWIKPTSWTNNAWNTVFMVGGASQNGGLWIGQNNSNNFVVRAFSDQDILTASFKPDVGVWTHVAAARSGTTLKLFYNGIEQKSVTTSYDFQDGTTSRIANDGHNQRFTGKISNLRIVKGTAVYTSNFNPSDSLTNITNTKLLCCNDSSVTGSTVTPTTITASGGPTASADSPVFTDVAANVFGENEDQNVIKCGSYVGTGSVGHRIELGWEPSFIIFKNSTDSGDNWEMVDVMRGNPASDGTTSQDANFVRANTSGAEFTNRPFSPYSTGFEIRNAGGGSNGSGSTYIYMAIRRPDGYVGKPPELGTDVFNVVLGNSDGSPVIPVFAANFPVDFALRRRKDVVDDTDASARLTKGKRLKTNLTDAESSSASAVFDSNVGWNDGDFDDRYPSWMWKRHAGFDVVCWEGDDTNAFRSHSLGKTPEMIWFKNRDDTRSWRVFHKGLNGGTNPEDYAVSLNASSAEGSNTSYMNGTAPTSTHFVAGLDGDTNVTGDSYIAMLFASVNGISKVGSFVGSDSDQTITLGFQPRFLIVKAYNQAYSWLVLDSTRGWATSSGNNSKYLFLELDWAQDDIDVGYLTSTGFVAKGGSGNINDAGASYIYYAHA